MVFRLTNFQAASNMTMSGGTLRSAPLRIRQPMHEFLPGLSQLKPPPMHRVEQRFDPDHIADVPAAVRDALAGDAGAAIPPGSKVAVAVGSRGIAALPVLVRTLCEALKQHGVEVFIVPAMGSHGGATAEGQVGILKHLGVTEAAMGVPIRSSMEVRPIGCVISTHGNTVELAMDAIAHDEADCVIPIVRVKPHTGFKGRVESGICKMLAIGLGKHVGCSRLHREGMEVFDHLIPAAGQLVLDTGKVPFALTVVENAYERIARVEAVPAVGAIEREAELLVLAKQHMAKLLLPRIDVLVVEEVGKNISGVGMDANVTGRGELGGPLKGFDGPEIVRIVVLSLTPETDGNAHGIGLADIITQATFDDIDRRKSWTNTLTAGSVGCGKMPIALPTEDQAVMAAASCVPGVSAEESRIVRIRNTLSLTDIAVSPALLDTVAATEGCEYVGPWDGTWRDTS